jgi:16S rRNA (cytosine967-C5)-methyltransferase
MSIARSSALQVLLSWQRTGTYPDQLLRDLWAINPGIKPIDRNLTFQLVFGVLRWKEKLDWVIQQFSSRPLPKITLRTLFILRLGAFQILYLSRIPLSAAVNESVKLAKEGREPWSGNFVNAVLRALSREKESLPFPAKDDPVPYLSVNYSHPAWLVEAWIRSYGFQKTEDLCRTNNEIPPLTIRVNLSKTSRGDLVEALQPIALKVEITPFSPVGIRVEEAERPLTAISLYNQGFFQIQDEASQLIAPLLAPQPGETILDLCAGFGGKTSHLAELMKNQGKLVALDLHPRKITALRETARRMEITILQVKTGDGLKEDLFPRTNPLFDRILIDAPCSGWGVINRNPDLKWRLKAEDGLRLGGMQNKFLQNAAGWLKSGGIIVYCTCTLNKEENQTVIQKFLRENPGFNLEDVSPFLPQAAQGLTDGQGCYQTWPPAHHLDGFFAARLKKKK